MTEVVREIATLYDVQGVFANRWAGSGMCYCDSCRALFQAAAGKDLPGASLDDPARRDYLLWRQRRLLELWDAWDAAIQRARPGARFIPNGPPGLKNAGKAPFQAVDNQARRGLMPPWAFGRSAKQYRAAMGEKPLAGLFSVGVEEAYRWKDSVQGDPEVRIWALDGIANGFRPWFVKFGAVPYDKRWLAGIEKLFGWHHQNERYLRNVAPLARVGLVFSEQTRDFHARARTAATTTTSRASITRWSRRACRSRWSTTSCSTRRAWTASSCCCCRTWPRCRTRSAEASRASSRAAAACSRPSRRRSTTRPASRERTSA
jgi:hypothetical protein